MAPYYFSNDPSVVDCQASRSWGVVKDDGETIGCHRTRRDAIDQMVAVSIAEDLEPGGEWPPNE
jgi:hypothetical protein